MSTGDNNELIAYFVFFLAAVFVVRWLTNFFRGSATDEGYARLYDFGTKGFSQIQSELLLWAGGLVIFATYLLLGGNYETR